MQSVASDDATEPAAATSRDIQLVGTCTTHDAVAPTARSRTVGHRPLRSMARVNSEWDVIVSNLFSDV